MSSPLSDRPLFTDFLGSLTRSLNIDTNLRVYHVSTPPASTTPIFSAPPGQPDEPTTCESHFLTVSQPHVISSANSDLPPTNHDEPGTTAGHVLILGIEVLIFSTESSTTVFVSKADSTGFLERSTSAKYSKQGSPSVIKTIISTFLQWLIAWHLSLPGSESAEVNGGEGHVRREIEDGSGQIGGRERPKRLVLSLFARAQNQYLFPGSVENTTKHVLDDRQLIKWWCRLLDELVQKKDWNTSDDAKSTQNGRFDTTTPSKVNSSATAYVVVPGCDRSDTIRSFFPSSARYPQAGTTAATWHNSYPVDSLVSREQCTAKTTSLPIRCLIPRLPDDPKARYCDDLDNAGVDANGQWRDIRSLQQFWETMEYRQECAAGRLVGFVWVVFDTGYDSQGSLDESDRTQTVGTQLTSLSGSTATIDGSNGLNQSLDVIPIQTGSTIVTKEQYITLSDLLIDDTDFAGAELATKSTQQWIDKVKELSGLQSFGVDVQGNKVSQPTTAESTNVDVHSETHTIAGAKHPRDEGSAIVNVLTGIRKKKPKVTEMAADVNGNEPLKNENIEHNAGIVSDKLDPKVAQADQVVSDSHISNGITTLSAGLVRKKQKPQAQDGVQ